MEKEKTKLLVRKRNTESRRGVNEWGSWEATDFIMVDLNPKEDNKNENNNTYNLCRNTIFFNDDRQRTTLITCGSAVYAVGSGQISVHGDEPPSDLPSHAHRMVSRLDLGAGSSSKWEAAPPMIWNRRGPSCATLGGLLYAFGFSGIQLSFGEVFDPKTGDWRELDSSSLSVWPELKMTPGVVTDSKNNRILIHFAKWSVGSSKLYAYYPDHPADTQWVCLDPKFSSIWTFKRQLVADTVVDDVLYFHIPRAVDVDSCIEAYDLSTRQWLTVHGCSSLCGHIGMYPCRDMYYLGNNKFCLVQMQNCSGLPPENTRSTKFFPTIISPPVAPLVNLVLCLLLSTLPPPMSVIPAVSSMSWLFNYIISLIINEFHQMMP